MFRKERALVVFKKELTDTLRDRKSLRNVVTYVFLGPLVVALTTGFVVRSLSAEREKVLRLPVIGAEFAPHLIEALADKNIEAAPPPLDAREAVTKGEEDAVLIIAPSYGESLKAVRPAEVTLVADDSRQSASGKVKRVRAALFAYSQTLGVERLIARGVGSSVVAPLAVQDEDVAPPEASGAILLGGIPIFLLTAFITAAVYAAVDMMAGERERGSLEPLLSNAVTDAEIVIGKMGALWLISSISMGLTTIAFAAVPLAVPGADELGIRFGFSPAAALAMFLWVLPLGPLTASSLLFMSSRAKSVRDANSQAMIAGLVPLIAGMPMMFGRAPAWIAAVPVAGQQMLISELLRGSPLSMSAQLLSVVATLAAGALMTYALITAQRMSRERRVP